MAMTPRWRKFSLLVHVVTSTGWIGAAILYLALAVTVLVDTDPVVVRGALASMRIGIWAVIVPLGVASLITGVIQGLGTSWGLFRHYWVVFKLVLNLIGLGVLAIYTNSIDYYAGLAARPETDVPIAELRNPTHVVHSTGGLVVLIAAAVLSVYKPKGLTARGRRPKRSAYVDNLDEISAVSR
ncbi:DUF2269 domain-containing protein [Nocardia nepalensis]|uniref:DUF2269 domain-containing protein n=1 Tax=Nocardia nepalensis TaxID=3375448 RepID=UPI003B679C7C